MAKLQELCICPKYDFVSDTFDHKNPVGKRWREIRLDDDTDKKKEGSHLKVILALEHTEFPSLEKLVLGNLIEMEECGFSLLRRLKVFRFAISR